MSDTISDAIEQNATKPAEVRTDEASVKARPLTELIEADKYLTKKTISGNPLKAIIITSFEPPGPS